jgi:hypothetical protein
MCKKYFAYVLYKIGFIVQRIRISDFGSDDEGSNPSETTLTKALDCAPPQ